MYHLVIGESPREVVQQQGRGVQSNAALLDVAGRRGQVFSSLHQHLSQQVLRLVKKLQQVASIVGHKTRADVLPVRSIASQLQDGKVGQ